MRLPREIEREIADSGLPYELERTKRHYRLRIAGRLAATFSPRTPGVGPDLKNTLASVRRVIREVSQPPRK